jgi:succinate-semialdehyde dehydrogenase/glutarate-semialdehyde dehydrogenase
VSVQEDRAMYDNLLANVPTDLYIGGKWRKSSDNQRFDVIDPATEKPIASVASASVEDAKAAVDAASAAMEGWAAKKPRERAEVLRKAFELIIRDTERFAKLMTIENGKALADSRAEVAYAAEFFRWYAEEAVRNIGEVSRAPASGARIFVQHKPAGVAVLVTPWNFPAAMATRKIGPALAAGCAVVLKPASETPLTMLALMPVMEEAGVPAGVINVLPSRRSGPVVDAMLKDPRVRVVSFTGSTEVGRKLLHAAADNVVKPAMELGGNAPFIVFEDADVDAAIDGAMIAKMRNMGEACTSANRFYVHEKVHDEFAKKLTARMQALKLGNGLDDGVMLGPLVNADTRDKVKALVEDAVGKGASVLAGGKAPTGPGYFYPATVLDKVPDSAKLLREEIFGPVAALQTFSSEDEVVKRANDTEYGLVAYVYTRDLSRGMRVSERLEFGMIGLNRGLVSDPAAPFGGMKQSGIGREGAHEGLMEFMETQYVSLTW